MEYIITEHAKERYAERVADRESNCDIKQYVAYNEEKIISNINKMMEYAVFLVQGKFGKGYSPVRIFTCGLWVIFVDIEEPKVITLYKISLGVGDDFDKAYMERVLEAITVAKNAYEASVENTREEINGLNEYKNANLETIAQLRREIKDLETINDDIDKTIADYSAKNRILNRILGNEIERLITKRRF